MCFLVVCEKKKVLGTEKAPGSCPYCGGVVVATDVESAWTLCHLPLCVKTKRNYACNGCSRRLDLVTYP